MNWSGLPSSNGIKADGSAHLDLISASANFCFVFFFFSFFFFLKTVVCGFCFRSNSFPWLMKQQNDSCPKYNAAGNSEDWCYLEAYYQLLNWCYIQQTTTFFLFFLTNVCQQFKSSVISQHAPIAGKLTGKLQSIPGIEYE